MLKKIKLFLLRRLVLRNLFLRSIICKICSCFIKNDDDFGRYNENDLKQLNENGFRVFKSFISAQQVESIVKKLEKLRCYDRYERFRGGNEEYDSFNLAPKTSRTIDFHCNDLLKIDELCEIANSERILSLVKEYLGVTPVLSNVSCWISQPQEDQSPKDSQYYHRDKDGLKWLKLFVYLTDVCLDSGPHCYISGSHKGNNFLKKLRLSDHEVFNKYDPKDEKVHIGSKGDAFIEDTFGIHKGIVPKLKKRIVLQFQYSIYPLTELDYPEKKQPLGSIYNSYVNQCFYK